MKVHILKVFLFMRLKEKDTNLDEQRKLQIKVSIFKHSILCLNPFLPTCS